MTNPADRVEKRKIGELVEYAMNSRTHSQEQIDQIAASITEWGWTNPVLVDESGEIIAGHGRILAAKQLGLTDVPVMVATGWTEGQKRAYVIADNKLALNAGWDYERLQAELTDIRELGVDIDLIGFSETELANIFGNIEEDEIKDSPNDEDKNIILVELESERETEKLFSELQGRGFKCKLMN